MTGARCTVTVANEADRALDGVPAEASLFVGTPGDPGEPVPVVLGR